MVSDFESIAHLPMSKNAMKMAFSASSFIGNVEKITIVKRRQKYWLQQIFSHTPGEQNYGLCCTGSQFRIPIPGKNHKEIYISYTIELKSDIILTKGGKMGPGLLGGPKVTTGGNSSDGYNGFSIRNSFSENKINMYTYHVDQSNKYGSKFLAKLNGVTQEWPLGRPIKVQMRIKMNTAETSQGKGNSKSDGILQLWHDGDLVIDRKNMRWRHDDAIHIDRFFYSAFYGGGDDSFSTKKEEIIWFADFAVSDKPLDVSDHQYYPR